jgi:hypothetical protein
MDGKAAKGASLQDVSLRVGGPLPPWPLNCDDLPGRRSEILLTSASYSGLRGSRMAFRICVAPWISLCLLLGDDRSSGSMKAGLRGFHSSVSDFSESRKNLFVFMMMMKRALVVGSRSAAWSARHCFAVSDGRTFELMEKNALYGIAGEPSQGHLLHASTMRLGQISRPRLQPR